MVGEEDRNRALEQIAAIARQYGLSAGEIAAVLDRPAGTERDTPIRAVVVRVLGYLGGMFIFAGVGVFVAMQWNDMNSLARVVITLGPGVTAFVLALLAHRDARFDKVTAPLFLIGAALEPTGMFVAFEEFGSGGDWRMASLVTTAAMALQFAAAFRMVRRSTPLFFVLLFGTLFMWTALDLLDADADLIALVLGASMLLAAVGVDRTPHRAISAFWYLLGGAASLEGFFQLVEFTPFEITFVALAAGFVYLSVVLRSRALLLVSTLAILAYTGWFTRQHFADSVGWPIALIIFGFLMIGLSAVAFRIDRDYVRAG